MNHHWIAVEGGGSRSTFSIVAPSLDEFCSIRGPAMHAARTPVEDLAERLESFIDRGVNECLQTIPEITNIALALAGAGRSAVKKQLRTELQRRIPEVNVFVATDVMATHAGAFNGGDGILVIAGTGSIVLGRKGQQFQRIGGYGYRMGDEGSGHLIGMEGLRAAGRHYDGQESTTLVDLLAARLDIHSRDQLIQWTYDEDHSPSRITPLVIECAENGDSVCQTILKRQTDQLAEMTAKLAENFDLFEGPVCCHGGLFKSELFYETFKNRLTSKSKNIDFKMPEYNPRIGVCLLAVAG